jgi:hypothetical protein
VEDDEEEEMNLVMPLIIVASNGGPYDDEAFVAGMNLQQLWSVLDAKPRSYQQFVRSSLIPQIDLLAMHFGYRMRAEPWAPEPEQWTFAKFDRNIS